MKMRITKAPPVSVFLLLLWEVGVVMSQINKCPPPETIMPCRCRGRNDQVQVWCSHSDLERVNGALENLMRLRSMPAIDELIVENNKMPTLPARAFGALQIGRLLLRNNGLESLSRNAFAGLEDSLEEIYIVEEKLIDFPFDAIEKLRNLEAFTIEKSRIRLLPRFNGLNRLKHIRIDGSLISGFPVGAFASMSSIKQIHVVNSGVDRLAEGIFGRLDSLLLANFTGNRIDHIQRRCFALLPRLEVLSLGNNKLSEAITVGRSMEELTSLKSLDLSNNQFKELPEGSFVNLRSLQLLNLAGNDISRVHTRSFTHLPALRKVDLSFNSLRNFPRMLFDTTPLLEELRMRKNVLGTANEVGELLASLKSLRYLDLGENGLTELPTAAIKDHTQLQTLDLSDNRIHQISRHAFQNVPSLQEMSLKNNSLKTLDGDVWEIPSLKELDVSANTIESVTQQSLKGLPHLARMDLSQNSLKNLPSGVFSNNKDILILDLSGNGMATLHSDALVGLSKLQKLDLSRNHLETLQPGSFRDLRSLMNLQLGNNRINNVPMNLLSELKGLEELNFRSNSLSFIPHGFFQSLSSLKDLNLKHNSIAEINGRMFTGLDGLEQIRLSSNQIRNFEDNAFDNMMKLRGIDLSSNRISRLPARSFKNLPMLEKFEARENRITSVESGVLANTELLQILDLAHNAITMVPDVIKSNPLLKVIDLSHNQIGKMDPLVFSKLTGLMELYLNDNKISGIEQGTFENLTSLTIVDMDGNEITEIPSGAFKNLPRLIYLRMSRNKVRRIAREGFSNLNSLDGLDLQENELEDVSPGSFDRTGALKYLNFSHNNLEKMSQMGLLALGSLEVLDLSYNKLSDVDIDALRHLIWLVELRMNDNGICMIPPGTFDGMSRLKMLVLRNNRLKHLYESVFYKLRNNIAFMDVSGNPLECDCEMTWLRNLMAREELQELSDSTCEGPGDLKGVSVKSARPGRMICNSLTSGKRIGSYPEGNELCPPLAQSKRKPRPVSVEPEDRPLFGNNAPEEFFESGKNDLKNRRKDDKLVDSDDYISGDTPTIYAGSSTNSATKATQHDVQKSAGSGSSVLSSLLGIPIDFGFNFGISPAFSWSGKGGANKSGSKGNKKSSETSNHGGGERPALDPLPPSWIDRPSKHGGNVYEAPEYLPRKPNQPYIPLNPLATSDGSQPVVPSGSVDIHKTISPHDNRKSSSGVKFPSETSPPLKEKPSHPSWHPNYPNTETGFIPIEPFFHNNMKKNKSADVSHENKYFPVQINKIPSDAPKSSTTEKYPGSSSTSSRTPINPSDAFESEEYEEDSDTEKYTPVQIQQTTEENSQKPPSDDFTLSDFWGMFSGAKNQSATDENQETPKDSPDTSYEDEEESNNHGRYPFNFSAPVDAPVEPDDEPEYNIQFGEPNNAVTDRNQQHRNPISSNNNINMNNNNNKFDNNPKVHVAGRPTITKIIETEPPSYNAGGKINPSVQHEDVRQFQEINPNSSIVSYSQDVPELEEQKVDHKDEEKEVEQDNPYPSPLVPPVIIGRNDAEPRDWYYTNYHKSAPVPGDELLERLLERSRINQLQDDLVTFRSSAATIVSPTSKFNSYIILSFLLSFVFVVN